MKASHRLIRQPALLLSAVLTASICQVNAQQAAAPAPTPPPAPAPITPTPNAVQKTDQTPGSSQDQAVVLSPFEVNATHDQGYYAQNTLAGTRLNNNIADLGSSITVVTKQQLEDTNSININDIFRYEANTEGARTYTPTTLVRTNFSDNLGGTGGTTGNFSSALDTGNRVRGLATADQEEDNFFSLYRIPFDAYNTQAVEIERGPNSIIFGSGSPAGIVNQDRSQATTDKLSGETEIQASSWGGQRETVSLNIPLIKDRLAIYVAQVYDSEGFKQKPSFDYTRREYAAFTLYPFKNHKTKLTGSIEDYNNYADDPNGITPTDDVTPWLNSGEPVWNPINDTISYLKTGRNVGPYTISSTYPNYAGILQTMLTSSTSPYFVPSLTIINSGHDVMFVDQGKVENFFKASQTAFSIPGWVPAKFTSSQALVNEERMTASTNLPTPFAYVAWQQPGITNKAIYDYSNINVDSADNTSTHATTYNLNFQQEILPSLNFQVAWFRQQLTQLQDSPENQASATAVAVDTNQYLPNGQVNPHLGQPFVDVYQADVYNQPEINNNWRAMLDYEPDLRGIVPSWLNWLGHHRFLGVFTQHDDIQTALRYRPAIDGGDPNYLPTAATLNNPAGYSYPASNSTIEQWLYLGGASAGAPGYGSSSPGFLNRPGYGGPTQANISTYNYATGQWNQTTVNMDSLLFATGGLTENLQDSKTFFWQSFFWDDRIIGSVGIDDDQVKNRNTIFPATLPTAKEFTQGFPNKSFWYNEGPWSYIGGNTSTLGVVLHPFKDWAPLDASAQRGDLFSEALRTLSFTFNKSNNFSPPPAFYTDYFGTPLGKPEGTEKDYGLEIASPDSKFFLRATWFNTTNENAFVTLTSTGRANYIDNAILQHWATEVVEIRNGEKPSDPNFNNTNVYPLSVAEQGQIAQLTGLPFNYGGNVGANGEYVNVNGTESGVAKGVELEATYNPLPNWTMKLTWGKQKTTITGAGAQAAAWINYRMPTWLKYTAPDLTQTYKLANGSPLYLGNFWQAYGFDGSVTGPGNINGWTTTQNYYNIVVAAQLASDQGVNGSLAPNQKEYSWTYLTNYTFDRGPLKHVGVGGALNFDGQSNAGYYGNTANVNAAGQILGPNVNEPIYTPAKLHVDAWVSYAFKMPWASKVLCKLQFNVEDLTSNGYLIPVSFNLDGSAAAERIIPPRSYSLSAKFSF
ncbi:MAG TPA: TonB-dependent receptor plug domain-containing protein [Opitutaceae bacterium]